MQQVPNTQDKTLTPRQQFIAQIVAFIMLSAFIVIIVAIAMPDRTAWDFRNNLYGPAFMVTQGLSAYDTSITGYPDGVWFPTIIGQFFWLGWIPFGMAATLWTTLTAFAFVWVLFLILPKQPTPLILGILLFLIPLYPPFYVHYEFAQISIYSTLMLVLALLALEKERLPLVGFFIVLASAKPQLILLPVLGLAIALWRIGGWRAWAEVAIAGLITGLLSLLPLFIADPQWLTDFFSTVDRIPVWFRPSYLNVFILTFGDIGYTLFGALCAVLIALNIWIWLKLPPLVALLWSMGINLIAIPLVWTWDFIMLLPLFTYYLLKLNTVIARAVLVISLLSVTIISTYIKLTMSNNSYYDWWIPTLTLFSILLAIVINRQLTSSTHSDRYVDSSIDNHLI